MDDVEEILRALGPDVLDRFEDELARRLGFERHPRLPYEAWRPLRVRAIEEAGERADRVAQEVEADLASGRLGPTS